MRRKPTKLEIADFEKKQEEILSNPNLLSAKKAIEEYHEKISSIVKNLQPTFDKIIELHKVVREATKKEELVYIGRPVEYQILDEIIKINKKNKYNPNEIIVTYNIKNKSLDRYIDGRIFSCDLSEKRDQLLDILIERETYVKTKDLKTFLKCPSPKAVSAMTKTFNDLANTALRLGGKKIIHGKQPDGYRINPKIIIEKM